VSKAWVSDETVVRRPDKERSDMTAGWGWVSGDAKSVEVTGRMEFLLDKLGDRESKALDLVITSSKSIFKRLFSLSKVDTRSE
jgi:hypothetical protein